MDRTDAVRPVSFIVTEEEIRSLCGRKHVAQRRRALHHLLLRAYAVEPKHLHYHNAIAINSERLRLQFGKNGQAAALVARYFDRVGNHARGKWPSAYRLNEKTAQRVETFLLNVDTLARKAFAPRVRPVGDTGLQLPDSIAVSLAHLNMMIERLGEAVARHGGGNYFASSIGSSQTLQTVYRQLVSVRETVISTGGLPNTYQLAGNGRWSGAHDHHVLRLPRTTRYLALGPRDDLWDADLSNAHLAITLGLMRTWHKEHQLPMLTAYLLHRDEWLYELRRWLNADLPTNELKSVARAWLYGSRRTNRGSSNAVIRLPHFGEVLQKLERWNRLYDELHQASRCLVSDSPPLEGKKDATRLSYLLSSWETRLMQRLGRRLLDVGVNLQAWLFDGFLLIKDCSNPGAILEAVTADVQRDLQREGFLFDHLGLKVRSVESLYAEVCGCLDKEGQSRAA